MSVRGHSLAVMSRHSGQDQIHNRMVCHGHGHWLSLLSLSCSLRSLSNWSHCRGHWGVNFLVPSQARGVRVGTGSGSKRASLASVVAVPPTNRSEIDVRLGRAFSSVVGVGTDFSVKREGW